MEPYQHTVQYYETDKMGIVHHSNYIRWMEEARTDFMDQLGFPYSRAVEAGVGFALTEENIVGGSLRLLFSFSAGLLMSRVFKPVRVRGAFWIGALGVVAVSAVPRIGGSEHLWMNGLYDAACAIAVFPLIVYLGASGKTTDKATTRICKFLGDISYPLYMVHYPFIYLYYAWVKNENLTFAQSLPGAAALVVGSVILAYLCLKLYDEPVRRFLTKRFLNITKRP